MSSTAVDMLAQSFLRPSNQLEGLSSDVDLSSFHLQMRTKIGIELVDSISSASLNRTMQGASTLTVVVEDDLARTIQRSGKLGRKVDVEVDGLFFTLVGVTKQGRQLTLKFEEREVNTLRYYSKYLQVSRDKVTRAEFALRLIKEVKEIKLRYVIPELTVQEPISDITPGQILVNGAGQPLVKSTIKSSSGRPLGIYAPSSGSLTVRGATADLEQLKNANTILETGVGMGATRKVLVSSIMTAIDESNIRNLTGGDRDSVGIFQQRASQGWPATRNIPTDAAAYFQRAMALSVSQPGISYNDLCQGVQHSGTPLAYGQYQTEAEGIVNAFGVTGGDLASDGSADNNQATGTQLPKFDVSTGYFFTRGSVVSDTTGQNILTPETSWACLQRLAAEVNWRCFVVSGAVYFLSDQYLFHSQPFMVISEDSDGVDTIDYDYDEGKRKATLQIIVHLSRWSAPPGSTIEIFDMGIPNGKWLIQDVQRSLYETVATITAVKPQPILPEPVSGSEGIGGAFSLKAIGGDPATPGASDGTMNKKQAKIVDYARKQLGVPYGWGTEEEGKSFDCSGLSQAAYDAAGIPIPRVAQAQFDFGSPLYPPAQLLPGDLVFFGPSPTEIDHVGIYIGGGKMIDAPHTGAFVRVDSNFTSYTNPPYIGAVRLWT